MDSFWCKLEARLFKRGRKPKKAEKILFFFDWAVGGWRLVVGGWRLAVGG